MFLRTLSLRGFKSFPDRTRLEFSSGVSVIVGPNGSGKSNVTDAVLWALGEQSPLAVRGQSMQDVIFAGGHGQGARGEAEVEVVLDNGDGAVDLPFAEVAILRRLTRAGEGEYRINGARCRLGDVLELLSDTGLGREMHSVVSQGRVEAIVASKPRDRRALIEEAAGLGKHRKRRRRAQLKLDRTQLNLDRALDVEREARTRLRPLKRQAEAAELHARLERQATEARWTLARDDARATGDALERARAQARAAREALREGEAALARVAAQRARAEEALAQRAAQRERFAARAYAARSAHEGLEARLEAARGTARTLRGRIARRRAELPALAPAEDVEDAGAAERVRRLEAERAALARDAGQERERELAALAQARAGAAAIAREAAEAAAAVAAARAAADRAADAARAERRSREAAADRARRDAAKAGAELAAVNHFLRLQVGAPGGGEALADLLRAEPGYELALAAALGGRLRAALAPDLPRAAALLDRAGRDGGVTLVPHDAGAAAAPSRERPGAGEGEKATTHLPGEPLLTRVSGTGAGAAIARELLEDVRVVDDLAALPEGFAGVAVTRGGRVWSGRTRELRQLPAGGEERVLAERNRRDALLDGVQRAAAAERVALTAVEAAASAVEAADAARDAAEREARGANRARDEARDAEARAARALARRRAAADEGPRAARRAEVEAALAGERRLAERARRDREGQARRLAVEEARLGRDESLLPAAERLAAVLERARDAVGARRASLEADLSADRETGDRLAAELRACAARESGAQARLREGGEAVTRAEVVAQRAADRAQEVRAELDALGLALGLPGEPASEPLPEAERAALAERLERLGRRREQLGPVNPLAGDEYLEALAHVEELEAQRGDLETALRELEHLIRDTDRRIRTAFEETFAATAAHFEAVAAHLFPGGRGRLRLVREDAGPRLVPVAESGDAEREGADPAGAAPAGSAGSPALGAPREELPWGEGEEPGVELEITPAGKATKRLSLLSGGERTLTALAFLFAVFLARPCPFYILDEVEAALDDLNLDRFLTLLRRYADRAQFIVVTHQRRTMEAADCLYGVSMAGDGVSKVVSRRLPAAA